jgi:hypothetical protein
MFGFLSLQAWAYCVPAQPRGFEMPLIARVSTAVVVSCCSILCLRGWCAISFLPTPFFAGFIAASLMSTQIVAVSYIVGSDFYRKSACRAWDAPASRTIRSPCKISPPRS